MYGTMTHGLRRLGSAEYGTVHKNLQLPKNCILCLPMSILVITAGVFRENSASKTLSCTGSDVSVRYGLIFEN
jgi:hypothetical protein